MLQPLFNSHPLNAAFGLIRGSAIDCDFRRKSRLRFRCANDAKHPALWHLHPGTHCFGPVRHHAPTLSAWAGHPRPATRSRRPCVRHNAQSRLDRRKAIQLPVSDTHPLARQTWTHRRIKPPSPAAPARATLTPPRLTPDGLTGRCGQLLSHQRNHANPPQHLRHNADAPRIRRYA